MFLSDSPWRSSVLVPPLSRNTEQREIMALVFSPSVVDPVSVCSTRGSGSTLLIGVRPFRSYQLLISQWIVSTSVSPPPPPPPPLPALPALKASCLQNITDLALVSVRSDAHTSLRLCEKLVPFLPLNAPHLCGLRLLTSSSFHNHICRSLSFFRTELRKGQ